MKPRGRLFRKYVVLFVVLVSGALVTSGLVEIYFAYRDNKAALVRLQRAEASSAAIRIEQFIKEIERQVAWTTQPLLDAGTAAYEQRRFEYLRLLRQVLPVTEISYLDASGKEQLRISRLAMDVIGSETDFSQDPQFTEAKTGKTYFSPVYFRKGSEPYLTLAVAGSGGTSGGAGVTVAEVNLKFIWDVVSKIKIGRAGQAYVIDSSGRLIAHRDISLVLQKTDLTSLPHVAAVRASLPEASRRSRDAAVVRDIAGRKVLTAHAAIAPLRWFVFVDLPAAEAFAPVYASMLRTALLLLLGLGLSVIASVLLARKMVTPIRALQVGAARIGGGDLGHRIAITTGDELEAFAEQFNRMAGELQESYAGLEQKVEERTRELREALEQQTATSDILRVISTSPTDLQPVLDAVAKSAARFCGADDATIFELDGGTLRAAAHHGPIPVDIGLPVPCVRGTVGGRSVLERRAIHMTDLQAEAKEFPEGSAFAKRLGHRTTLGVPLLREGTAIGTIQLRRLEANRFTDKQVALLQTFADQAVIAIENVRLFRELEQKNRALTQAHAQVSEALEQQTATAEILRVISSSPTDTQPVFAAILDSATRLCAAENGILFRYEDGIFNVVACRGLSPETEAAFRANRPGRPGPHSGLGRMLAERRPIHIADILDDVAHREGDPLRARTVTILGARTAMWLPLLKGDGVVGALAIFRHEVRPFTSKQIELVATFADQAVIAIENVRLFKELQEKNRSITEALEQQTATSEILRVISSSPTDIQPVLNTLVESAGRLCEAYDVTIWRVDGDVLRLAAHHGPIPQGPVGEFSLPLVRGTGAGRSVLDGRTVHVADLQTEADEFPESIEYARRMGFRTILSVPLIREGVPIGAIVLRRTEAELFTERQVALLQTFTDQAVIAIENVRLFKELEARNAELTETLARQIATGEVLRAISQAQTDAQPVFNIIAGSARRLCGAAYGQVQLYDGERIHLAALESANPEGDQAIREVYPLRVGDGSAGGRAIATRAVVQIPDLLDERAYAFKSVWEASGLRSLLAVPMVRDGEPIGTIGVGRTEPGPFPQTQIDLLQTFADQAVIAIENVRLFKELQARNRDLSEALEQQTATGEILRVISSSPIDEKPVFDAIARSSVRLCGAAFSVVAILDADEMLHLVASEHVGTEGRRSLAAAYPMRPNRGQIAGRAILDRAVVHVADVTLDPEYVGAALGNRATLSVPMLRKGTPIGTITIGRFEPVAFTDQQIELLKTFADQAVIAIENVRLFKELEARNRELTQALEQQTATSEILKTIAHSQTDVQPVFDTIVRSAARLCNAANAAVFLTDGRMLYHPANYGSSPEALATVRARFPRPLDMDTAPGRAILSRSVVHVPDIEDPSAVESVRQSGRLLGFRSVVTVPMLREGEAVGALLVARREPGRFSDVEVDLLKTFADQAVIAIENVRLFKELQARNRDLTATSEILRVIASSPTDLQPVFDAIAERSMRLCEASFGWVMMFDGELIHLRSLANVSPEGADALRRMFPVAPSRGSLAGRTILTGAVVHVPDVLEDPEYEFKGTARATNVRSCLTIPLLHQGRAIGVIAVARPEPGTFSGEQMQLLQTFADQAVIAIENVRLFTELQARNREVTEALEQQTATSEVLKVISRSTFDLEPVLRTLVENAARLCSADAGFIFRLDGDVFRLAADYGASPSVRAFVLATPFPPGRGSTTGRAALERRTIHIADVTADPEYQQSEHQRQVGYRTTLAVPMLREGALLGVFFLWKARVEPFTDKQIDLVATFADQAVIAIENVRLFKELEGRNRDLTEALEQQTATAEILRVISSSPTDVQPVFDAIAESALRLCEAKHGNVFTFDGDLIHLAALANVNPEISEAVRRSFPRPPDRASATTRAILNRSTVVIPDVLSDPEYLLADVVRTADVRSVLAVPMLREGRPIGAITVTRAAPGPFPEAQVALLKTFADQAVIAVENVRLFKELRARTGDLAQSLEEVRGLSEVSQAISSSLNLRSVLDGVAAHAVRLSGSDACGIFELAADRGRYEVVANHNLSPQYLNAIQAAPTDPKRSAIRRAAESGQIVQIPDIAATEEVHAREIVLREGFRALLVVPMGGAEVMRGMVLFRRSPGDFDDRVVTLLTTLANQSKVAIDNARLFQEIGEKSRQLEIANQHKSEFLASMSHELRTPLNAIIGFSEVLLERMFGELNPKQDEYLQDVMSSGRHLLSLINDILDLSKIEAGRMELELSRFHLPLALENTVTLMRERALRQGVTLYLVVDQHLGDFVGDERKVKQILLNLLSNAIKFTPSGGRVDIKAMPTDGNVEISVSDTGIGIAEGDQETIFEEFRLVGSDYARKGEGTGLGLALTKKFVELHGGRIWVKSEVGRGSTFTFTLPVRR